MADFRSDRMPTPDGRGIAKSRWQRAWDAYSRGVKKYAEPVLGPAVKPVARTATFDLMGFWLAWHLEGGFEGLQDEDKLGMSRSAVYRRVALFRRAFGVHPDEFKMPGVAVSVEHYLRNEPYEPEGEGGDV